MSGFLVRSVDPPLRGLTVIIAFEEVFALQILKVLTFVIGLRPATIKIGGRDTRTVRGAVTSTNAGCAVNHDGADEQQQTHERALHRIVFLKRIRALIHAFCRFRDTKNTQQHY